MKNDIDRFMNVFEIPDFMRDNLDYFFTEEDVSLVLAMGGEELSISEAAERFNTGRKRAEEILARGYRTHLLDVKEEEGKKYYFTSDFYDKLDYNCKFAENYDDMPVELRARLDEWCYEVYREQKKDYVLDFVAGKEIEGEPETFLPPGDIEEYLAQAEEIRVVPCNCRRLKQACDNPVATCLVFNDAIDERTSGKPLSRAEAKSLIEELDRKGLMHSVNTNWHSEGPRWMCNCCTCCCYPQRLAEDLDVKGEWPQRSYYVQYDEQRCIDCGVCVNRCPNAAFYYDKPGSNRGEDESDRTGVRYNSENCLGCGLCVSTCPEGAINLQEVNL